MVLLSNRQVDTIHDLLLDRGVHHASLRMDLLDHLCCMVEEHMDRGDPFEEALSRSVGAFGPQGLERTQEETLYLLTLKHRRMKKFTSITGITGGVLTIAGAVFKLAALPGAGAALLLGILTVALLYLPSLLIIKLRESQDAILRFAYVSGTAAAVVFAFSMLFKLMHWPMANMLMVVSLAAIAFVFMPVYFIRSYRRAENKLMSTAFMLVLFAGVFVFYRLTSNGNSKEMRNSIYVMHQSLRNEVERVNAERLALCTAMGTDTTPEVHALVEATDTLVDYIEGMRVQSIVITQDVSPLDAATMNIHAMSWGVAVSRLQHRLLDMEGMFNAHGLRERIEHWKVRAHQAGIAKERLNDWLSLEEMYTPEYGAMTWEEAHFKHATIVSLVTYLDQLALEVNQRFLQVVSASAPPEREAPPYSMRSTPMFFNSIRDSSSSWPFEKASSMFSSATEPFSLGRKLM